MAASRAPLTGRYRHSARLLATHAGLLARVTSNDVRARYAGSLLGAGWLVVGPLLTLAVYAGIYLYVFKVRAPGLTAPQYVVFVFSGLVPFLATAEALSLSVTSVVAGRDLLLNTVFPIDLAPVKAVLMAQGVLLSGLVIVIISAALVGALTWTALLVPVVVVAQVATLVGVAWVISLLNVVFRDLQMLISILLMLLLVVSPIAYTTSMVPGRLRLIVDLNPFAYFVIAYQDLIARGTVPSALDWAVILAMAIAVPAFGGWFFSRIKRVLVDHV